MEIEQKIDLSTLSSKLKIDWLWYGSFILIIITFVLVWLQTRSGSEQLVLHYNVVTGVDILGPYYYLYLLPFSAVAIVAVNILLIKFIPTHKQFFKPLLTTVSLLVSFFIALAVFLLYRLP